MRRRRPKHFRIRCSVDWRKKILDSAYSWSGSCRDRGSFMLRHYAAGPNRYACSMTLGPSSTLFRLLLRVAPTDRNCRLPPEHRAARRIRASALLGTPKAVLDAYAAIRSPGARPSPKTWKSSGMDIAFYHPLSFYVEMVHAEKKSMMKMAPSCLPFTKNLFLLIH